MQDLRLISQGGEAYQSVLDDLTHGERVGWFFRKAPTAWDPALAGAMKTGRAFRATGSVPGVLFTSQLGLALYFAATDRTAAAIAPAALVVAAFAFGPAYEKLLWRRARKLAKRFEVEPAP